MIAWKQIKLKVQNLILIDLRNDCMEVDPARDWLVVWDYFLPSAMG